MAEPNEFPFTQPTIDTLGTLCKKPALKPKLLSRPPFKFLHDVVTTVQSVTGFPAGLYNEQEANANTVTDKDSKLSYLSKLFAAISVAAGTQVTCDPLKVIAGLECETTNIMLQQLYTAAVNVQNGQITMQQVLAHMNGEPLPAEPAAAEPAAEPEQSSLPQQHSRPPTQPSAAVEQPVEPPQPTQTHVELPLPTSTGDYVALTQQLLQPLFAKPKLTDKLLQKPPFRFIHDIVTAIYSQHQYPPAGYYSDDELNSANYSDSAMKLQFLQKLIDLLQQHCPNVDLSVVTTKKITAGLEPEFTNLMLQTLGYVVQMQLQGGAAPQLSAPVAAQQAAERAPVSRPPSQQLSAARAEPAQQPQAAAPARPAAGPVRLTPAIQPVHTPAATEPEFAPTAELSVFNSAASGEQQGPVSAYERPKTARRAPPRVKSQFVVEDRAAANINSTSNGTAAPAARVLLDNAINDEPEDDLEDLAEDADADAEAEAADVWQAAPDDGAENDDPNAGNNANSGFLTKQIMKQKREEEEKQQYQPPKTAARGSTAMNGNSSNNDQLVKLQKHVQDICRTVQPLGKVMSSAADDVEAMKRDFSKWKGKCEQHSKQLTIERQATEAALQPLHQQLIDLDEQIAEIRRKSAQVRSHVVRNEQQIEQILLQKTTIT